MFFSTVGGDVTLEHGVGAESYTCMQLGIVVCSTPLDLYKAFFHLAVSFVHPRHLS